MITIDVRVEDLSGNSTTVTIVDAEWYNIFTSDSWSAARPHSIGRDNHGSWSFLGVLKILNLNDSSGTVVQFRGFPVSPKVGDSGEGFHNTPGKYIADGVIGWEVTSVI
jgi:hypothetical protein